MASVQIRIDEDTYNAALASKGRLSIVAYFANLREELSRSQTEVSRLQTEVSKLQEELRKAKKK